MRPSLRAKARHAPTAARVLATSAAAVMIAVAAPAESQSPAPAPTQARTGPFGVWYDDTGRGAVEIRPCGSNLCGAIYWLKEPAGKNGQPLTDGYNPDPSKRARPVCGLQVLGDVKPQGDGTWDAGWVYDPKVGKSYDVHVAPDGRDRLTVTGYKGVKFLSKTLTWTRAPADLPKCDGTNAATLPSGASTGGGQPVSASRGAASGAQPAAGSARPAPPAAQRASTVTLPPPPSRP